MKYLVLLLALTASAFGQSIKAPGVNGENIVNPAFRNAVLTGTNVDSTELGYLNGVTSAIQTQLNAKAPSLNAVFTGTLTVPDGALAIADTTGLQTALDGKQEIPYIPVVTKSSWTRSSNVSSAITLSTSRRRLEVTNSSINPKLVYTNTAQYPTAPAGRIWGDNDGANTITVKAAIEDDAGTITPVYFSGVRSATIPVDGSLVLSDALTGYVLTAGKTYYVRTLVTIPSGGTVNLHCTHDNSQSPGEGRIDGVDNVDSGTITTGTGYSYSVNTVLAQPTGVRKSRPVVGLLGDSIFDQNVGGNYNYEDSWVSASLGPERGRNYSHIRLSMGSYRVGHYIAAGTAAKMKPYFPLLTHVVCNLGINDVRDAFSEATIKANYLTLWRDLKAAGVEKIWQCTITPDQSVSGTDEPMRLAINTWLRTVPNPLYGIIECADAMETARDSGVWKGGYSTDNLHPNATGAAVLKTMIPLDHFQ